MTGPRPLQQLLGVIESNDQWKQNQERLRNEREQLRLQAINTDISKRSLQGQLISNFMNLAPNAEPMDRAYLAGLISQAGGGDQEALMGSVANRAVSQQSTQDKQAAASFSTMQDMYPRMKEAINSIPDTAIRDVAMQAVARQFAGMPVGQARTDAAVANPDIVSPDEMKQSVRQSLQLIMTPAELKRFDQQDEQIRQGWTGLADKKTQDALMNVMNMQELDLRRQMFSAQTAAKAAGEKFDPKSMMPLGTPKDVMEQIVKMSTSMSTGPKMTDAGRNAMATTQNALVTEYLRMMGSSMTPGMVEQFRRAFSPGNAAAMNSGAPMFMR